MTTFQFDEPAVTGLGAITFLTALVGLASAIFWMIVGWRAMRAHEKLADTVEEIASRGE